MMRYLKTPIELALLAALASVGVRAQAPEKPATLMPGLGSLHHAIRTNNSEAQRFFDQGLTLVYAFNHEEAVRSFKRAAELDPASPMPWWGVALAVGPNYNLDVDPVREKEAYDAIQKARTLAAGGAPNERDYVEALAQRYTNDAKADLKTLAVNYAHAMRDLAKRYPDDSDAATLYAESLMDLNPWQLWTLDGKPGGHTEEIVAVLRGVLARDPEHIGANHFYIHALEASPHPEAALASAYRMETLVPAAGHLVHMPSHIYERTGFYAQSAKSNQAAAEADRAYLAAAPEGTVYGLMYYGHNLHFLAIAASMAGNFAQAKAAADRLAANASVGLKQIPMLEWFLPVPTCVLVRFGHWDEIAKLQAPDPSLEIATAFWHYARGLAFAAKGSLGEAAAERGQLAGGIDKEPADAMYGFNAARTVLTVALDALDARIAEAGGDRRTAIDAWRKAVSVEDALAYDEPEDWYYPVRESLGAALYRDAQLAEAERVFRADLERNPRNPRSLFGLWQTLKAEGKTADAAWVSAQFAESWTNADAELHMSDL